MARAAQAKELRDGAAGALNDATRKLRGYSARCRLLLQQLRYQASLRHYEAILWGSSRLRPLLLFVLLLAALLNGLELRYEVGEMPPSPPPPPLPPAMPNAFGEAFYGVEGAVGGAVVGVEGAVSGAVVGELSSIGDGLQGLFLRTKGGGGGGGGG